MKKDKEEKNRIEFKGDNKVVIQDLESKHLEEENIINVKGSNNIVIQNSGSSNINISRKKD
jgi:hypothetical protein